MLGEHFRDPTVFQEFDSLPPTCLFALFVGLSLPLFSSAFTVAIGIVLVTDAVALVVDDAALVVVVAVVAVVVVVVVVVAAVVPVMVAVVWLASIDDG